MSNHATPNWEDLLAAYLSGQPGADTELIKAATPVVVNAVRSCLAGPDVDDATQEALLDVLRKAGTVREPSAFLTWIKVVSRNAARRVRRQQARALLPVDGAVLDRHAGTECIDTGSIEARLDASGVLSSMRVLTHRERHLMLLLTSDHEPSYEDVSEHLGWPVGSIGPTRQRALSKLRRHGAVLAAVA